MPGIVRERNDKKYSWVQYVHSRIRQNKNFLANCWGPTGSGKSWSFISFASMIDPDFDITRIVFSAKELMDLLNSGNLKKGSVILWDESGVGISAKEWQSLTNKMINFLVQTFRHQNIILLFTAPFSDFIDSSTRKMFHAEFKTRGIDYKNKTTKIQGKLLQYNPDLKKFYRKHLRVITSEGVIPIIEWNIPAPSKELIKQYEIKKTAFTKALNMDIYRTLKAKDSNARKELTEFQKKILGCWQKGIFIHTKISEELNEERTKVTKNVGFMRNKGYMPEEYREANNEKH